MNRHMLAGCSFTDPMWQTDIPWSVEYAKTHPSYIVAKAGMGIRGICTETLYYLKTLNNVDRLIIILPTLWRMDIEVDEETYLCNSMVHLLEADSTVRILEEPKRKWLISGGLNYDRKSEQGPIFDFLYKQQGFLVILKEHLRALTMLLDYCKLYNIKYTISAIEDPMDQLVGLDYIRDEICQLLDEVEYNSWLRFDGKFIDQYLGHNKHPTTEEHKDLCQHILKQGN